LATGAVLGALLWATPALADPPPAEAPPPGAPPAAAPTPPPAAPPPAAPAAAPPADAKPPTAAEAMPATRPEVLPPIDVGAWVRAGSVFQGATDPSKLNDWHMDTAYVELHAGGKVHKNVSVTLNLNSNMMSFPDPNFTSGSFVAIEDAIISFDFVDQFHLWAGHLLVPVDRSNASGPFFMIPWNYPGLFTAGLPHGVAAPQEGPSGRNNGAVVWGDIAGGKFTYLAGAFDNGNAKSSPLFSGHLRLDLLDAEGGFWGNGSFFGDKDIFAIDVGAQFQKHGSAATDMMGAITTDKDWSAITAGLLFEKKLGGGSFVTGEGAYYHYSVLDGSISDHFYVLGAYATPTVGVGSIQPMVRYQYEKVKAATGSSPWNLDVGLSYLIKGPALRVIATYGHTKFGPLAPAGAVDNANSIQIGAQAIFF
jgi:hypothetical protein